jgi:hypothetical protein
LNQSTWFVSLLLHLSVYSNERVLLRSSEGMMGGEELVEGGQGELSPDNKESAMELGVSRIFFLVTAFFE